MTEKQSALFPTYARFPIELVRGEGMRAWDKEGKAYLDLTSGIGVNNLGHAPQKVKEALVQQLDQLWHVSNLYPIAPQEQLAQLLTDNSCADLAFFCNSGAEANEAAIKVARRYHSLVKKSGRYEIITCTQSFHGRTLATLTATGQDKVKEGFLPLPEGFVTVPYNDTAALEAVISDKTAAIMIEMVQGEGGVIPADPAYVKDIVRLCEAHDLLFIVDEIQTGIGRTGKMFGYEHFGVEPDIFTLAKALGSGFPIGAMLGKEKLREAFVAGSHGSTFGGNPLATTAGVATMQEILSNDIVAKAEQLGIWFRQELEEKLSGFSIVEEIRGIGLMLGIICNESVAPLVASAREHGLLVLVAGPQVIRLLPSLTATKEELAEGAAILAEVFAKHMEKELIS